MSLAITALPYLQVIGALIALAGGAIAVQAFRLNARTNKSKFILDLTESFLRDKEIVEFSYHLDYETWKFDLSRFRHSPEERYLDTLLNRCAVMGQLLRMKSIGAADLANVFSIIRQIFSNEDVRKYLQFHMLDFYRTAGHVEPHFPDAHYLYINLLRWAARSQKGNPDDLKNYLEFVAELKRIPYDRRLREAVAARIGYDRPIP